MIASVIFYVVFAFLAGEALYNSWSLYHNRQDMLKYSTVLGSAIFHIVLVAFFGAMAPWGDSVSLAMWWLLVISTGIYAGFVVWRLMLDRDIKSAEPA